MVSKEQIKKGLLKFMEEEMIPVIEDKNLQIITALAVGIMQSKDSVLDSILQNKMVTIFFPYNDKEKTWDIENGMKSLKETLNKYGALSVTIPAIPFIAPEEKQLKFSVKDIERLEKLIVGEKA